MFSPPVYITIGDEYDKRHTVPVDESTRVKPFVVSAKKHPHITDSMLGGYTAMSSGEAYTGSTGSTGSAVRAPDKPPFRPAGSSHKSSGKGDYYGTFSEKNPPRHAPELPPIDPARDGTDRNGSKYHTRRPMYTNPPKKGTYGYTGLTIQKKGEIQYISDPYEGNRRRDALDKKAAAARQMGAPFRAAVRSGGCFDETEHGFPKVYSLSKPLPAKKPAAAADSAGRPPLAAKPWIPGGALVKEITQYPEYIEDPYDDKERKVQELRRAEREYQPWKPAGNDPYRHIYTKPIQYSPPPVL